MKASEVLGRAVVIREGGQKSGKVKDLVVDPTGHQVLGFVLAEGVLKKTQVARWAGLQTIGEDNVIFNATTDVVKLNAAPEMKAVLDSKLKFKNRKLQTTSGKDLGQIEDLQFDERTGAVLGYELSGGIFSGHHFLPTPPAMEVGKDIVFVAPEVEATIQKGKAPQSKAPQSKGPQSKAGK
jgi:uncharacterized protein YrrD